MQSRAAKSAPFTLLVGVRTPAVTARIELTQSQSAAAPVGLAPGATVGEFSALIHSDLCGLYSPLLPLVPGALILKILTRAVTSWATPPAPQTSAPVASPLTAPLEWPWLEAQEATLATTPCARQRTCSMPCP